MKINNNITQSLRKGCIILIERSQRAHKNERECHDNWYNQKNKRQDLEFSLILDGLLLLFPTLGI